MEVVVSKRYMKLPVTPELQKKTLRFYENNRLVREFVTRLDTIHPQSFQYPDMGEFTGKALEMEIDPEMDFVPQFTDCVPPSQNNLYRPSVHFTADRGWINDPNGPVFYEGMYHLFFQHNPADTCWGNLHWGHAVSHDLLHWEQTEDALFPDSMGMMFSGSAVTDSKNVTGLKENEHDVLLLYYTAASPDKRFTQCLAYSTDGGKTFVKYYKNPIVDNIAGTNRDPKVVYVKSEDLYYMALWLEEHRFALLTSKNLLDWESVQDIILPEDAECPDLYPLTSDKGNTYWVFTGASDKYLIGEIRNKHFHILRQAKALSYNGKKSYAAQSFSGTSGGRVIRIAWNRSQIPCCDFNGSMTTPMEMSLKEQSGDIFLCCNPISELCSIVEEERVYTSQENDMILSGKSQDILLELSSAKETPVTIELLGLKMKLMPYKNRLEVEESTYIAAANRYETNTVSIPLFPSDNSVKLRLITDVHSTEIYTADGRAFACIEHIADRNLNKLKLTGDISRCRIVVRRLKEIF